MPNAFLRARRDFASSYKREGSSALGVRSAEKIRAGVQVVRAAEARASEVVGWGEGTRDGEHAWTFALIGRRGDCVSMRDGRSW